LGSNAPHSRTRRISILVLRTINIVNCWSNVVVIRKHPCSIPQGKVTGNAIGMIRKISEPTLEIDEELCFCFTDWQKAFD